MPLQHDYNSVLWPLDAAETDDEEGPTTGPMPFSLHQLPEAQFRAFEEAEQAQALAP